MSSRGSSAPRSFSRGYGFSAPRAYSAPRSYAPRSYAPRYSAPRSYAPRYSAPRGYVTPRGYTAPRGNWRAPSYYGRVAPTYRSGGYFYQNGRRLWGGGRIDRIVPWRGGYRIWLGGWGYPFYIPYSLWDPFRFRLGLYIGFNAFYDPLGFYSIDSCPPYAAYPYDSYPPAQVYAYNDSGDDNELRGTVVSIDLHSGIVVIAQAGTHRNVTALLPPRDNRVDDIRVGDYVEFNGQWASSGNYDFDAARMDRFDPRR